MVSILSYQDMSTLLKTSHGSLPSEVVQQNLQLLQKPFVVWDQSFQREGCQWVTAIQRKTVCPPAIGGRPNVVLTRSRAKKPECFSSSQAVEAVEAVVAFYFERIQAPTSRKSVRWRPQPAGEWGECEANRNKQWKTVKTREKNGQAGYATKKQERK